MLKINQFMLSLVIAVILIECAAPGEIPSNYLANPRGVDTLTNGCWIFINQGITNDGNSRGEMSGELIAAQNDTFFILTRSTFTAVPTKEINTATLLQFKDQTGKYVLATSLAQIPNIAGAIINGMAEFLAMGIPFVVVGVTTAVIEGPANKLRYPKKNRLDEFGKFARFPQGIPSEVDLTKLTVKINDQ